MADLARDYECGETTIWRGRFQLPLSHPPLLDSECHTFKNWGLPVKFSYARVSSNTQDHAAQVEALQAAGCERIFSEKASGKSTSGRPEFARLMKTISHGDVLVVAKLDRLPACRQLHPHTSS
jgi:hypothetical protein